MRQAATTKLTNAVKIIGFKSLLSYNSKIVLSSE